MIAWLIREKLAEAGWSSEWEFSYPNQRRKKCDLVLPLTNGGRLWLEIKLAWKAWVNCSSPPKYSNGNYLPYLRGINHTHSFRGDFEKLMAAEFSPLDFRAVCLIGFDYVQEPMDTEVADIVRESNGHNHSWLLRVYRSWDDRRGVDFRINVWAWLLDLESQAQLVTST